VKPNHRTNELLAVVQHPRMIVAAAVFATLAAASFALHPPATHAAQTKGAVVSTAKTSLGRIIVKSNGRTLYLFGKDRNGKSACSGQCATFWPPLITSGKPRVTSGAKASLVGTTRRTDGGRERLRSRLGCGVAGRSKDREAERPVPRRRRSLRTLESPYPT